MPRPFEMADPTVELVTAYQRGAGFSPVSRRTLETALKPFDFKLDSFANQTDLQIRRKAEGAVLARHRKRRDEARKAALVAAQQQAAQQQAAAAQVAAQQAAAQAQAVPRPAQGATGASGGSASSSGGGALMPNTSTGGTYTGPAYLPPIRTSSGKGGIAPPPSPLPKFPWGVRPI